eukprot:GABU01005225.1.p1 GENE.GABU01005225.1~~GABU01005225.1.p1  ORF type:complete len:339 (+),score=101.73 GABU01005225.1:51-1067(+)
MFIVDRSNQLLQCNPQVNPDLLILWKGNQHICVMEKPAPTPERFSEYIEADDGSGFFLEDSKMFFPFDEFGGWYDEHDNYYNSDGQPAEPPLEYNVQPSRPRANKDDADEAEDLSDPEDEDGANQPVAFRNKDALIAKITEDDDALIDEFEEGAMLDEYEEVEEEDEDLSLMQSEFVGIDFKAKRLIRDGATSLSWLVVPKDPQMDLTEDLESMKVPFRKFDYRDDGIHVEIEKAHIGSFLSQAFTPDYYGLFTVHLEQDEDDIIPDNNFAAQEHKFQVKQRMKMRQPLKTTSEDFIPEGMINPASLPEQPQPQPSKPPAEHHPKSTGARKPLQLQER